MPDIVITKYVPSKKFTYTGEDINEAFLEVREELYKAMNDFNPYNSSHEGYGVILEELEELFEEVRKKRSLRDKQKMRHEAMQVASTAVRFMLDLTKE